MTIPIVYVGSSHIRTVTTSDFMANGVNNQTTVTWNKANNYLVTVSDAAGVMLLAQGGEFVSQSGVPLEQYVGSSSGRQEWVFELAPGAAVVGLGAEGLVIPYPITLTSAWLTAQVAPTGASLIADLRRDTGGGAASVFTSKPTIASGNKVSTMVVPTITALPAGTILLRDINQIGSTVAGSGVHLFIQFTG